MSGYLKMFGNCLITRGAGRAMICDLQKKEYRLIPLSMADFIGQAEGKTTEEIMACYDTGDLPVINEYLDFLLAHEYIFYCSTKEELAHFPPLSMDWQYPARLTNVVLDVYSLNDVRMFCKAKDTLFIPYIQLHILEEVTGIHMLEQYADALLGTALKGIQLLYDNRHHISAAALTALCNRKKRIETIIAYNSREEQLIKSAVTHICITKQQNFGAHACGVVSPAYFNLELQHFTESQRYNTCLNRKMSIGADGTIRNCPAMPRSYGNISDLMLRDVLEMPAFKEVWTVHKDEIDVCRDCEFRHICTDCRAFTEDPYDKHSKPLKCGYNPYTCEWETWSTHPLKQQAIRHYGL